MKRALKILANFPKFLKVVHEFNEAVATFDDNKTIGEFKKECKDVHEALKEFFG